MSTKRPSGRFHNAMAEETGFVPHPGSSIPQAPAKDGGAEVAAVAEHPILFSTEMVKAIMEGRKTMTRRIVNPQPDDHGLHNDTLYPRSINSDLEGWNGTVAETGESVKFLCRYGKPGDILWVRENWNKIWECNDGPRNLIGQRFSISDRRNPDFGFTMPWYEYQAGPFNHGEAPPRWKPSIHMPKSAARIWLLVEDIQVTRIQDINNFEARLEGVVSSKDLPGVSPLHLFISLWHRINGYKSWSDNPWVWVVKFKVLSTTGRPIFLPSTHDRDH